jgi:hypothetical protein
VAVQRAAAGSWLPEQLAQARPGTTTVVWHSVVWQYLGVEEAARIEAALSQAGDRASPDAPLVHLRLEPERRGGGVVFALRSRRWPGPVDEHLADAQGHGPPVRLLG